MVALLESPQAVAFDAEWLPDVPSVSDKHPNNKPSLLQLATPRDVWLVDLEQPLDTLTGLLRCIALLLASEDHRILGFGVLTDLNKLQLLFDDRLLAKRVVDLRDACLVAETQEGGPEAQQRRSLASVLARWAGVTLDKTEQCSDWQVMVT